MAMKNPFSTYRISEKEDESLGIYLHEISKHQMLSAAEEAVLAKQIRKGDSAAFKKLIRSNLRFVVSVCKNYQNQGLPMNDLINEGNLGLIRAAQRFDEKRNFKFISYAVWWIRQAILQALAEQSRIVNLPLNRVGVIHRIGKTQVRLEQKLHRTPNTTEIARELCMEEAQVYETIRSGFRHISLDAPVGFKDENDALLIDILQDKNQEHSDDSIMELSLRSEIDLVLKDLTERENMVLKLYFGIGEEAPHTLEQIGERFGLTRERVRQIKEKAIKRLRHSSRSGRLRSFQSNQR
jgi:RNA polymerase primary sigma factor